jgi:membrane protein implicated in regulation of membrane protease activity
MILWTTWWIWAIAAIGLAVLEIIVPAYLFLGFAGGAAIVALLFGFGGPMAVWMAASLPVTLLIFAVVSLVTWIALRKVLGVQRGQVRTFDTDIND